MMKDRRVRFGAEPREGEREGLVHERSGMPVSVRVATPWDGEGLRRMFSRASSETIFRRFRMPYPEVPERMLALMLDGDHHDKDSLVAVAGDEIVGHAMYVRLGRGNEAEMAIIVEDGWQSKGVGKLLLSDLAARAGSRGIEAFTAEVLVENRRMLRLAAMFAATSHTIRGGVYHVRIPLPSRRRAAYAAQSLRRSA